MATPSRAMAKQNSELNEFREKWRAEVSAKLHLERSDSGSSHFAPEAHSLRHSVKKKKFICPEPKEIEIIEDKVETYQHSEPDYSSRSEILTQKTLLRQDNGIQETALDHYEQAVKREDDGNLGESLDLYRKAFRMDYRVDRKYKNKHYPTDLSTTLINTISTAQDAKPMVKLKQSSSFEVVSIPDVKYLITSFSGLSIQASTSQDNEDIVYPCPLARLPQEILIDILTVLAIYNVACFARTALVCKKIAYLVTTEQQIWKRICLGSEFGFGAMHYEWSPEEVSGSPLFHRQNNIAVNKRNQGQEINILSRDDITEILLHKYYSSSWYEMFRSRPRIRFNGCYISTVNYLRPGEASSSQVSWNSPILIVTYYRFLRFFRDGSVISLLTTNEPMDVVPFLTKEYQDIYRIGGGHHNLLSRVMQKSLRGRWHLGKYSDTAAHDVKSGCSVDVSSIVNDENDVFIETEGVTEKYLYQMMLSLRSSNRGCKNNKLIWRNFNSLNRITNELDEFCLKEERPFFWSRVKSYGNG